jgi:N-acetylmuramoyl-L-alanine amidase
MDYERIAYKYMYGETPNYDESKNLFRKQKQKVKSAFLVAFKMETRLVFKK